MGSRLRFDGSPPPSLRRRSLALALPCAAPARAAAAPHAGLPEAPCAAERKPVVVLSYWKGRHLPRLVRAIERSGLPAGTPIYYGNYWGAGKPSEPKPPKGRRSRRSRAGNAPIFPLMAEVGLLARAQDPGGAAPPAAASARWTRRGRIPRPKRLMDVQPARATSGASSSGGASATGSARERKAHQRIVTWQLDEIPHEVAGRTARGSACSSAGCCAGSPTGARSSATCALPGIVWITQPALKLAGRRARGDLAVFWRQLDRSTIYLVGEEYPNFTGPARRAARRQARGQARLWHAGGARRSLARKYVAGMTPGYRLNRGLGGNVRRPLAAGGAALAARLRALALAQGRGRPGAVQLPLPQRAVAGDERRAEGARARGARVARAASSAGVSAGARA